MPDSSAIPVRGAVEAPPAKAKAPVDGSAPSTVASVIPAGPRKLIRPRLPAGTLAGRNVGRVSMILPVQATPNRSSSESSHAEAFYFQKQIHSQTLMVFVLEDGQQIEGYIEWYDRNSIKVRHGARTLIYKSSIKYIYKAGENNGV
jgi:sRNA-binding regulator protein Hfq